MGENLASKKDDGIQTFIFKLKNVELKMRCELEQCFGEVPNCSHMESIASF